MCWRVGGWVWLRAVLCPCYAPTNGFGKARQLNLELPQTWHESAQVAVYLFIFILFYLFIFIWFVLLLTPLAPVD